MDWMREFIAQFIADILENTNHMNGIIWGSVTQV